MQDVSAYEVGLAGKMTLLPNMYARLRRPAAGRTPLDRHDCDAASLHSISMPRLRPLFRNMRVFRTLLSRSRDLGSRCDWGPGTGTSTIVGYRLPEGGFNRH